MNKFECKIWCEDSKLAELGIEKDLFLDMTIDLDFIYAIKEVHPEDKKIGCNCWLYCKDGGGLGIDTDYEIVKKLKFG